MTFQDVELTPAQPAAASAEGEGMKQHPLPTDATPEHNKASDARNVEASKDNNDALRASKGKGKVKVYHTGWRLHALTAALCVSLLLSTLETTIVSTALVSIVDALHGFDRSGWVVTSYLLTYTGFLIIYSKLSDILGCKLMLLSAITIFTIFSIACGLSESMLQLIVFRAFQGMGASGIYSLSTIMVPLMVPPEKFATYISIITSVFAISSVVGPLLGGAISDNTSWRWVFFLNGPGGALAAALLVFSVPFGFPYGHSANFFRSMAAERAWRRIDVLGAFLSLGASILLIFALQQGGIAYPWGSGPIIATFVISGVMWVAFMAWERKLSLWDKICEPLFPWRLVTNRFVLGLVLNGFLTGFPFMSAIINIPQRLQTVNAISAIDAGVRLLPLLLLNPVGTAFSGVLVTKLQLPPLYILILGGVLQTLGVGLFSSLDSTDLTIPNAQYGYQVLMGLGFGFNLATILMMAPMVVPEKDMAVTMGAVTQIRVLGGTIGLALCSALLVNHIKTQAASFLSLGQIAAVLLSSENMAHFPEEVQRRTRMVFAEGYSQVMRVMMYFCVTALLSLGLLVERSPRRLKDTIEKANAEAGVEATGVLDATKTTR